MYHFQAEEVPAGRRGALQRHLDRCPDCARLVEVEQSFLKVLDGPSRRVPAPPGLETRIRAALAGVDAPRVRRGLFGWAGVPAAAAALLALTASVGLFGVLSGLPGGLGQGRGHVIQVSRAVTVVDQDCDRAGRTVEQQQGCRQHGHVNALKPADGMYWNLSLGQALSRELALDPTRRGERILIEGDFYPELSTILLRRIGLDPSVTL